jgi:hypothetical protein
LWHSRRVPAEEEIPNFRSGTTTARTLAGSSS